MAETFRLAFPDTAEPPYTRVSYGLPFYESCSKHARETFKAKRAYVIASRSLSKSGDYLSRLEKALGDCHVGTWVGIAPHTPLDELMPIIEDMREKQADCLITLGGGSLTDGAKIIVYAIPNNVHTVDDLKPLQRGNIRDKSTPPHGNAPTIPIICIPTTLSAGEYSNAGGGVDPRTKVKVLCAHPKMYPSLVILDPELTISTPEEVWLQSGCRAIDHCVESFCSLDAVDECDAAAVTALKALIPNLVKTKHDPEALGPRLECQLAANRIMIMLILGVFPGASHGIGHQLGPFGVGHGHTSCVLLPAVMKYNAKVNAKKQEMLKEVIWDEVGGMLTKRGLQKEKSDTGDALRAIFNELGMPKSLADVGVGKENVEQIAVNSLTEALDADNRTPEESKKSDNLGRIGLPRRTSCLSA